MSIISDFINNIKIILYKSCWVSYTARILKTIKLIAYKLDEIFETSFMYYAGNLSIVLYKAYIKALLNAKTSPVLITELNDCHGETLLSVYKYFNDLGYKPDILITNPLYTENLLKSVKNKTRIFVAKKEMLSELIEKNFLSSYKLIFFNSYNLYYGSDVEKNIFPPYNEVFNFPESKSVHIGYLHHLDFYNQCIENNFHPFSLADMKQEYFNDKNFINPHYFGKTKITPKNKITNFISVGKIDPKRKNTDLLIETIKKLVETGHTDFKVSIVGYKNNLEIPEEIEDNIEILGRLNYPDLWKNIQKSDFLLTLLDPDNSEHDRYLETGTSGSFQLIYGFRIPCLIAEKFASFHLFNKENSIIYSKNDELYDAMIKAINMNQKEYKFLQDNLNELSNEIYEKSLSNLKNTLNELKL